MTDRGADVVPDRTPKGVQSPYERRLGPRVMADLPFSAWENKGPYNVWRNANADEELYGMADFNKPTYRATNYGDYESGWDTWPEQGDENCRAALTSTTLLDTPRDSAPVHLAPSQPCTCPLYFLRSEMV